MCSMRTSFVSVCYQQGWTRRGEGQARPTLLTYSADKLQRMPLLTVDKKTVSLARECVDIDYVAYVVYTVQQVLDK